MDRNKLIELLKDAWNDGNSQYHDCKHNWEYKQDLQNWLDNYEDDINELCEGNPANSENANCAIFGVSGRYSIDFGKHCKAKIRIENGEPKVEAAMNGWGDGISLSDITIEKL